MKSLTKSRGHMRLQKSVIFVKKNVKIKENINNVTNNCINNVNLKK